MTCYSILSVDLGTFPGDKVKRPSLQYLDILVGHFLNFKYRAGGWGAAAEYQEVVFIKNLDGGKRCLSSVLIYGR